MATMERPRPAKEKTRKSETKSESTDAELEERIQNLKEIIEKDKREKDENQEIEIQSQVTETVEEKQQEEISATEDQDVKIGDIVIQETNNVHEQLTIENAEVISDSQHENSTIEEETVEHSSLNESPVQNTSEIEQTEGAVTTDRTTEGNILSTHTNNEQSLFLYPRLSLSLWSSATAPQHTADGHIQVAVCDPYSVENFQPSKLQNELREKCLPFINITGEDFLTQQESFITKDPRLRSKITLSVDEVTYSNEDDPNDEIYYLISSFFDIRTKIDQLTSESTVLEKKIADLILHVWSFSTHRVEAGAHCGDHVYLKRSIICEKANFDRNLAKAIGDTQEELRKIIYQQYVALKYQTLWFKMKIDIYISELISHKRSSKKLLHTIEVLFNFQRFHTRDEYFYHYIRQLLKKMVDIVYKYGTYDESLFVINHVLRCPPGISHWATNFVRFLLPSNFDQIFSPAYIRYTSHFLATLLFPVKNRNLFLENWPGYGEVQSKNSTSGTNKNQQNWMLIDADGQERAARLRWDTLNEEDLIVMLNQFNLSYLMKILFGLNDTNQPRMVSYENSIKILAILDLFVEILCRAFDTYADSQYKNFHRHIGKMIRDCVHVCRYQVDEILQFLNQEDQIRLRDHYFAYIYRSVENIIRLCRNVRWSSLALFALFDLPPSLQNRLLHLICSISDTELVTVEGCSVMDEMLVSSTQVEILSLLQVLHNLGRNEDHTGEISNVIFYISFLHPISRGYAMHDGRSILSHLTSLRPALISHILKLASIHTEAVGQVLFSLFRALSMEYWTPTDADLSIIEKWIEEISTPSVDFQLALYLIDLMNWQYLPGRTQLCIPHSIHCEIALLLLRVHLKYCDKVASTKENQLQQQNFMRKTTTNLDQWIWTAILRLQLNPACLTVGAFIDSMNQDQVMHSPHHDDTHPVPNEAINEIQRAIDQYKNPIAQFISFGLSQAGANAAGFFEHGIDYFIQLVQNAKYTGAIKILHDMSGVIVRSVDYLIDHVPFMNHLKILIDASEVTPSFIRTASSYLLPQKLHDETSNSKLLSAELLSLLIWLEDEPKFRRQMLLAWFKLLTAIKEWNKDGSILFVLDNILTHSFVHDVMNEEVNSHLFKLAVSALNPQQNPQAARTGFLSWISSGSGQIYWSSLSIESTLLSRYPMVGYYFLNAESSFEIDQNVLIELKAELEVNPTGKAEIILKRMTQQRNFPPVSLNSLSINRWGAMASDMPSNHPILPIVWEKFFTIYLSKQEHCLHRVGHRLFESPAQTTFLKQMKSSLNRTSEYFSTSTSPYAKRLASFYHALSLWIEEPRLHDPQLNVAALPQQYKDERLLDLFNADFSLNDIKWLEFVDIKQLYALLVKFTNELSLKKCSHSDTSETNNPFQGAKTLTSTEKLVDLVSSIPGPAKVTKHSRSPDEQLISSNKISLKNDPNYIKDLFEQELYKIINWVEKHRQRFEKQIELDQAMLTILPTLWKNESQQQSIQAFCQNQLNPVHQCTRAAYIIVTYEARQESQTAKHRLESVSTEHSQLLSEACRSCDVDICRCVDVLDQILIFLTPQASSAFRNEKNLLQIIDIGTELFYILLKVYNDQSRDLMEPICERLSSYLDRLGDMFIRANLRQPNVILEYILSNGVNVSRLVSFFDPNILDQSEKFIDIYQRLSKLTAFPEYIPYVLQMFRKFNVRLWFENVKQASSHLKFVDVLFNHFCVLIENYPKLFKGKSAKAGEENFVIETLNQLFDISIGHMIQILSFSYPSQVGCLFFHLVELIQTMRKRQRLVQQQNKSLTPLEFQQSIESGLLPSKVLSEFLEQIKQMEKNCGKNLTKQQIDDLIGWMNQFVMEQTIDLNGEDRLSTLYRCWRPSLNELTRIYSEMIILNIRQSLTQNDLKIKSIFDKIISAYGIFIDPSNSLFSLGEWKTIIDHQGDMLTRLIKTFVQLMKEFYEYINESCLNEQELFNSLFSYWYKIVRTLIPDEYSHSILDIYHRHLTQIPWENYRLTIESVLILDEVISMNEDEKNPSSSLYEFVVFLVSSIDARNWISRSDERTLAAIVPNYFRVLIKIFSSSQAKHLTQNDSLSRISSQSDSISWKFVDENVFREIVDKFLSRTNDEFILSARASTDGYLNRFVSSRFRNENCSKQEEKEMRFNDKDTTDLHT